MTDGVAVDVDEGYADLAETSDLSFLVEVKYQC